MKSSSYRQRLLMLLNNIKSEHEESFQHTGIMDASDPLNIQLMAVDLTLDSQVIRVTHTMDDQLSGTAFIECRLGRPRAADEPAVHRKLLSTNYALASYRQAVFSIDPISHDVIYTLPYSLDNHEHDHFTHSISSTMALIPSWRAQLRLIQSPRESFRMP